MMTTIKRSSKPDGPDTSLILPSDWNTAAEVIEANEAHRNATADAHPIGAVTGLRSRLAQRTPPDLQAQIIAKSGSTLLHNFQTDVTQANATVTYDTIRKFSGARSLKMTLGSDCTATARIDFGASPIDLSANTLSLMGYLESGAPGFTQLYMQLWGDGFVNLGKWPAGGAYGGPLMRGRDSWQLITFMNTTATPVTTPVRYVDIHGEFTYAGADMDVWFNELRLVPKPATGYVTITLDGANALLATQLKPLLDAKGYRACMMLGQYESLGAGGIYMTKADLDNMAASGWDISTHSGTTKTVVDMTSDELHALALMRQEWLRDNGYNLQRGGRFLCGLQNAWDTQAADILKSYFWGLRTGYASSASNVFYLNTPPMVNPAAIVDFGATTPYATQATFLERAALHKAWATIIWHEPGRRGELTLQQMSDALDLIDSLGLKVVTFSEMFDDILGVK
jgi:hypothetical protein